MVVNKKGGSHKHFARKELVSTTNRNELRESTNEYEVYAVVTKNFGNCMFEIVTIRGNKHKMRIRGKFSGKSKRKCFVTIGSYVLVGFHDFESNALVNPDSMCDLLELYEPSEVIRLKQLPSLINYSSFFTITDVTDITNKKKEKEKNGGYEDDDILFTFSNNSNTTISLEETDNIKTTEDSILMDNGQEVNFDDI